MNPQRAGLACFSASVHSATSILPVAAASPGSVEALDQDHSPGAGGAKRAFHVLPPSQKRRQRVAHVPVGTAGPGEGDLGQGRTAIRQALHVRVRVFAARLKRNLDHLPWVRGLGGLGENRKPEGQCYHSQHRHLISVHGSPFVRRAFMAGAREKSFTGTSGMMP